MIKEGISVTTLGLGLDYNEDLMPQLARRSDGNNYFIENSTELASKFGFEFKRRDVGCRPGSHRPHLVQARASAPSACLAAKRTSPGRR